jgi:hypothetical protein
MVLTCYLNKDIDVSDEHSISVKNKLDINIYKKIALCGIEIEKKIISSNSVWTHNPYYNSVIIIWGDLLDSDKTVLLKTLENIRGDELVFKNIMFSNINTTNEWVAGNIRSVINWCSGIMFLDKIKYEDNKTIPFNFYEMKKDLVWFSQRINLKTITL